MLLGKYNEILNKVSNTIKIGFDSEPVYNEKNLKTKIIFYIGKTNTNFHKDKMPEEGPYCICLAVIFVDSFFQNG